MQNQALGLSRRAFLRGAAAVLIGSAALRAQNRAPNVIFIYADDLGYGDLSCYGSRIQTPNLDRMAQEGIRFTNFYSAAPVCSPSRAALMTGRYAARVGVPDVLFTDSPSGLTPGETTIADVLRGAGYSTMCIGKWHLGTRPEYMPSNRGFDEYYGIPYSNDMSPLPMMHNLDVMEQPTDLSTVTQRYTQWAVNYIAKSKDKPFFLYMPHTFPHIPLAVSPAFRKKSGMGLYGDVVQEIDWSVGQVLQALKDNGVDDNTLVIFSSDNGPWYQGSPGRLRGRKGDTFEGGMREPFIARFPGRIPAGQTSSALATTLDILPTVTRLSGGSVPGKPMDGVDIWPILSGQQSDVERSAFLYFKDVDIQCARVGPWKLHISRLNSAAYGPNPDCGRMNLPLAQPELYNVVDDPEESTDQSDQHPEIVADIQAQIKRLLPTFPAEVINAYNLTMSRKVWYTPVGAQPVQSQN